MRAAPADRGERWVQRMRSGDFSGAWRISDEILRARGGVPCWDWPRHLQYIWDGSPLERRRVLIRCYHGLGDTVQFVRYCPLVRAIATRVMLWAQPQLRPVLETLAGVDELLDLHDGVPDVAYDVDVESMELPHVFRTSVDTIPAQVPYLHARPTTLVQADDEAQLRVGLVWSGGTWDSRRSVPVEQIMPLFAIGGVQWHILQRGPELMELPSAVGVRSGSDDVLKLAEVMRALDLVISIDSFPAHLAGALGVPTWLLLHAKPDWRWMMHRTDSPWYPTMRLFRQRDANDWPAVIAAVATALQQKMARQSARA